MQQGLFSYVCGWRVCAVCNTPYILEGMIVGGDLEAGSGGSMERRPRRHATSG